MVTVDIFDEYQRRKKIMKYFSEKTGKLYDTREKLEQAEQEYDVKKDEEKAADEEKLTELKDALDKITEEYRTATAKVDKAKCAAAEVEKRLKEADRAYWEQKEKIKAKKAYASKRDSSIFDLDPAVSALLKYFGY